MTNPEVRVLMLKGDKGDGLSDDDMQKVKALVDSKIADEAQNRRNVDAQLNEAIDTEKSTRESADTSLKEALDKINGTPSGSSIVVDKSLSIEGAGADAKVVGERLEILDKKNTPITYNTLEDCNTVEVEPRQKRVDIFNIGKPAIKNLPDNFEYGSGVWILESYNIGEGPIVQYLLGDNGNRYSRTLNYPESGQATEWVDGIGDRFKNLENRNVPITYNTLDDCNTVDVVQGQMRVDTFNIGKSDIKNLPSAFEYGYGLWILDSYNVDGEHIVQYLLGDNGERYSRTASVKDPTKNTEWQDMLAVRLKNLENKNAIFYCGPNEQFTTLRAACESATLLKNATVIVRPGVYDLTKEFEDHISAQSGTGIILQNGIRIIFQAGSYVKAEIENGTDWSQYNFEPFASRGDFELIGLNISAKNTRYCVHDEHSGQGTYHHIYRNCVMKYRNTMQVAPFIQCIGGGLGEHGFIEIYGGVYNSHADVHPDDETTISYHNGNNENCDSKIFISNVYLKNKGRFRFGYYGPSTIKSLVQISNCSVGKQTAVEKENSEPNIKENFEVIEMGVTVRP